MNYQDGDYVRVIRDDEQWDHAGSIRILIDPHYNRAFAFMSGKYVIGMSEMTMIMPASAMSYFEQFLGDDHE